MYPFHEPIARAQLLTIPPIEITHNMTDPVIDSMVNRLLISENRLVNCWCSYMDSMVKVTALLNGDNKSLSLLQYVASPLNWNKLNTNKALVIDADTPTELATIMFYWNVDTHSKRTSRDMVNRIEDMIRIEVTSINCHIAVYNSNIRDTILAQKDEVDWLFEQ